MGPEWDSPQNKAGCKPNNIPGLFLRTDEATSFNAAQHARLRNGGEAAM